MKKHVGHIIALAYPYSFVQPTKGRYNRFLRLFNIGKNNAVNAGHAALVLINSRTGDIHYGDFGRYIVPNGFGRARTEISDPDVKINFKAKIGPDGGVENLKEIIQYLDEHPEITHGENVLCAGLFENVNFEKALKFLYSMSRKGSISYGPFDLKATNCSRFVKSTIKSSTEDSYYLRRLKFRGLPSPMPLDVVMSARKGQRFIFSDGELKPFHINKWPTWTKLLLTREEILTDAEPTLYKSEHGTWLSGEGEGSWFELQRIEENEYQIKRITSTGELVFCENFSPDGDFDIDRDYTFVFDCSALFCTIVQGGRKIKFNPLCEKENVGEPISEFKEVG